MLGIQLERYHLLTAQIMHELQHSAVVDAAAARLAPAGGICDMYLCDQVLILFNCLTNFAFVQVHMIGIVQDPHAGRVDHADDLGGILGAQRYLADSSFTLTEQQLRTMTMQELLRAMEQQLADGVNGLIIRAENTPEVRAAITQAVRMGVTVITYDADVPDSGRLCHVGQDLWRAGAIAAGVMARLIRPREHVLVVTGNLRMEAHKGRVDGFCRHLCELGFPMDAYRVIETNEMPALTSELVAQAFAEDRRLRAVYMATQPVSGCIAGLRQTQLDPLPHVICNDLTPAARRYLREGLVDFVVGQAFEQESFRAVLAMYQVLMQGRRPQREVYYTDLSLLSREML